MTIVSAYLVPGSPLPQLRPDVEPWGRVKKALENVGKSLAESKPDCVLVYSTQWFAVLDQLWINRPRSTGLHVDANWHEFGEQKFDIYADADLANKCIDSCNNAGIKTRGVNYDQFPIDTGTITATTLMGFGTESLPVVIAANNLYHSPEQTEKLGSIAIDATKDKRIAVIGIGSLSDGMFREGIELKDDHVNSSNEDEWNQRILKLIEGGDTDAIRAAIPEYVEKGRPDMGFKHFHWLLGAMNDNYKGATVHEYAPLYGSAGAVIEFKIA